MKYHLRWNIYIPQKIYSQTIPTVFFVNHGQSVNPSTRQLSSVSPLPSSVSPLLLAPWSLLGSPRPSAAPSQWGHLRFAERLQEKSKMLVNNDKMLIKCWCIYIIISIYTYIHIYIYHNITNNGDGIMMNNTILNNGVYSKRMVNNGK